MTADTLFFWVEFLAVALALLYNLLAIRQNIACWYAAGVSSLLFLIVFFCRTALPMQAVMQVYYLIMAYYCWYCWRNPPGQVKGTGELPVSRWALWKHCAALIGISFLSMVNGYLLTVYTESELAYLDAWTAWASIFATWMISKKLLENWAYWIVIDSICIYLYWENGLSWTVLLFVIYIVLASLGLRSWLISYQNTSKEQLTDHPH